MGKDSNLVLHSQRRLARGILIVLAATIALFVLFASGPNAGFSIAQQQTTTPPPSSPAQEQHRIQFLNPSGHSEEISAKDDGSNTTYHLVAWVNSVPADGGVVFAYNDADGNEVEIGEGTPTPIADTYELQWDIPAELSDGSFTLHAILYSGQTEVARDTESDLTLNNKSPSATGDSEPENRGETVEMTYPTNGGAFGFYTPRDRAASGVIEVTRSSGASTIRAWFTTSAPGDEPNWTQCGSESASSSADGVRCTLPLGQDPSQVTALAVAALDSPAPFTSNLDSGDAHRIAPYSQTPTTLALDPASQGAVAGQCSGVITATVTDQNGVAIAGANVDVHAAGPTDDLYFDDGSSASSNQPPENGHRTEAARDCSDPEAPASSGTQGEHEDTTGNDRKHIESASDTNDDGKWSFQLTSTATGSTQYTAWVDDDADDVYCSSETNASGAIGWGEGPPGITGLAAETSDCPEPVPSSPDPGPTTPDPNPTDSPTPDPRGCTKTGTNGNEQIDGTPGDDVICAYGGDDIIRGMGGDDVIYADDGDDEVQGGGGRDHIYGGSGEDILRGNAGADRIEGQRAQDLMTGGGARDIIIGGGGSDTIRGSGGVDRLIGEGGFDIITGGPSDDVLRGGKKRDVLRGGPGSDRCHGGAGRDQYKSCEERR